jgi:hypothetical protein
MCFSAQASFAGALIISSIGVVALTKVKNPKQRLFAAIPLFFGFQQFIEGIIWLLLNHPENVIFQKLAANLYLIFAHALWPLIIPLSVLLMEENVKKIRTLRILTGLGTLLAIFYISCLFIYAVTPQINCYHILYVSDFPLPISNTALLFYLVCAFTPLFMSSNNRTKVMGGLMLFSCIVAVIFFTIYLTSVWCFFAALISAVVVWIVNEPERGMARA